MTQTADHNGNGGNGEALAKRERAPIVIEDHGEFANLLDTGRFEHLWRVATLFASSQLVPVHFQNKAQDCFVAVQMALRLGIDPLMLLQNTYVYKGKPGMEGKLAIALINTSGLFDGPIRFEFAGSGDDYGCMAWAKVKATGERIDGPRVTLKLAKDEGWYGQNQKWRTMTDMMLRYRAGAWFGKTICPERLMGMQTIEELHDLGEVRPVASRVVNGKSNLADRLAELPEASVTERPVSEGKTFVPDAAELVKSYEESRVMSAKASAFAALHKVAPDPAPVQQGETYAEWLEAAQAIAQSVGIEKPAFDGGLRAALRGYFKKNKVEPEKTPPEWRRAVLEAIQDRSGYFAVVPTLPMAANT